MRMQKYQSQRNNMHIHRSAESPNKSWRHAENKLHEMLYDQFTILTRVIIKRLNRV